jgi:hypothetical protein
VSDKRVCYKVVTNEQVSFRFMKEHKVECTRMEFSNGAATFYDGEDVKVIYYKPISVEFDSTATEIANMSTEEKYKYYTSIGDIFLASHYATRVCFEEALDNKEK